MSHYWFRIFQYQILANLHICGSDVEWRNRLIREWKLETILPVP